MMEIVWMVERGTMFECSANKNVGTNYNVCCNDNLIIFIGGCIVCRIKNG